MAAWTNFADPGLFNQLAFAVVVGYPGGDSSATGLGALGPGRGLHDALLKLAGFRLRSECRQGFESVLHDGDELVHFGEVALGVVDRQIVAKLLDVGFLSLSIIADPFLTALAWHFNQPGVGAAQRGQGELLRAKRNAAYCPVDASALVLAVGLEALSILVDPAVVLAWSALGFGSADASDGPMDGPEVALQPFGVVTRLGLAAVFVQLSGTHFTAAAAV